MLNRATTLATAAYCLLPQKSPDWRFMVKQTLKRTQNQKMQVGFTNEADILLHAPCTSPSETSPTLADTNSIFCLCLIWKLCCIELGNKLMYAKFAGVAKATKVLDLVKNCKENGSFAFQTKDSPRNKRYLKMSTSTSGIKSWDFSQRNANQLSRPSNVWGRKGKYLAG